MKNKIYPSADAAVADIKDGTSVMFGGFGGAGFPHELIRAVGRKGSRNLFAISNNCGTREGELFIWQTAAPACGPRGSWPQVHQNLWNTNDYSADVGPSFGACR